MRTTRDLILELEAEAKRFTHAALVVGFEKTTVFVLAADPRRLEKLNDAVRSGGEPVGLALCALKWGNADLMFEMNFRPLAEYAHEPRANEYLHSLYADFRDRLKRDIPSVTLLPVP